MSDAPVSRSELQALAGHYSTQFTYHAGQRLTTFQFLAAVLAGGGERQA